MAKTLRDLLILLALATGVHLPALAGARVSRAAHLGSHDSGTDHHVILVVADGLRWQEVFRGADSAILVGGRKALGRNAAATRNAYWRASVTERREALMPFVWNVIAREGQLFG